MSTQKTTVQTPQEALSAAMANALALGDWTVEAGDIEGALRELGWIIVPHVATDAMLDAADVSSNPSATTAQRREEAADVWCRMIGAAP